MVGCVPEEIAMLTIVWKKDKSGNMKVLNTSLLFVLLFTGFNAHSSSADSLLFMNNVKQFAFKETGFIPTGDFYTKWATLEKPYLYLYVSRADSVKQPQQFTSPFIFYDSNETLAVSKTIILRDSGYHTFCYKTYANSSARLNNRLLSYSHDAVAFIVFHELIHNYINEYHIKIPYEFNEALCDVIGNYGALAYASTQADRRAVQLQLKNNEHIYRCLNSTISKINRYPTKTISLNVKCTQAISHILKTCNSFQHDRFDYPVNNAYLLKNQYYCRNYFLLKQVFLKQHSIKAFLEVIKRMPGNNEECLKYLKRLS